MTRSGPAYATPEVLRWARETAALDLGAAAKRINVRPEKLSEVEEGNALLTLRQAEVAAKAYGRSLAVLFMQQPPDEPPVEVRHRRLPDAPEPPWSPEMVRLESSIKRQQIAVQEIYDRLGEDPAWPAFAGRIAEAEDATPAWLASALNLSPVLLRAPTGRDRWHSRRVVIEAVEAIGVMVRRDRIPDEGVRGFVVPDEQVPVIFVHSGEDPRAQAFTVLHELAHLLAEVRGRRVTETWCEKFAGAVLMPKRDLVEAYRKHAGRDPIETASAVAHEFGVTPAAAATRARSLEVIPRQELLTVLNRPVVTPPIARGDGNRNKVARLGAGFTGLVLAAAGSSAITLSEASRLLGTRVGDFDKLGALIGPRT